MTRTRIFCLWLALLSLLLPLLEFIAFAFIYSTFIKLAWQIAAAYIPISVLTSLLVLYLIAETRQKNGKRHIFVGYLAAISLTLAISIILQESPHWIIANFIGGGILLVGIYIAYTTRPKNNAHYIDYNYSSGLENYDYGEYSNYSNFIK